MIVRSILNNCFQFGHNNVLWVFLVRLFNSLVVPRLGLIQKQTIVIWKRLIVGGWERSSWKDLVSNEEVRKRCQQKTLQQFISHHRLRYLGYLKLESLKHRRTDADKKFFNGISQPDNCLHHLPPPPRDTQLV